MIDQPELHGSKYFMKDMTLFKKCCIICKRQFAFEPVLRKKCANEPKMCCRWEAAIALVMHPALWEIKGFLQSDYVKEIALLSDDTKQCLLLANSPICCVFCAMQYDSFTS